MISNLSRHQVQQLPRVVHLIAAGLVRAKLQFLNPNELRQDIRARIIDVFCTTSLDSNALDRWPCRFALRPKSEKVAKIRIPVKRKRVSEAEPFPYPRVKTLREPSRGPSRGPCRGQEEEMRESQDNCLLKFIYFCYRNSIPV